MRLLGVARVLGLVFGWRVFLSGDFILRDS